MTTKTIRALWYGGSWLLLTLWLRLALPETLMGFERHQLFRFSADYLTFFSPKPYPFLLYVQAFFTQFYIFPLLGAAVIGGLLTLGLMAWRRLCGWLWPGLIWIAAMLPALPYFNLLWVLLWLILLAGAVGLQALRPTGRPWLMAGLCLLAPWLLQENAVLAWGFWGIVYGVAGRSWKTAGIGLLTGAVGLAAGFGLLFWQGYPAIYTQHLSKWELLKFQPYSMQNSPATFSPARAIRLWVYIGLTVLIALPLLKLCKAETIKKRWEVWLKRGVLIIISGLLLGATYLNLRYAEESFHLVDRLVFECRWDEAAAVSEQVLLQRESYQESDYPYPLPWPTNVTRPLANQFCLQPMIFQEAWEESFITTTLKASLLSTRTATDRLMTYYQSDYFPFLFPNNTLFTPASYYMALYDTQNGLYAEALHLLYDLVTGQCITPAVLEPLLWNCVVVGDYAPCRKFIRLFEQSLFHKDVARRYTAYLSDTAATGKRPEVVAARQLLSKRNHTVLAYYPDDNTRYRIENEADNAAVYEYALSLWLVYKNHPRILEEWPKIRRYYPKNVPIHLQEAVLTNFTLDQLDEVPEGIAPEVKARYADFRQASSFFMNGFASLRKLKKSFGDTYWYHLYFYEVPALEPVSAAQGSYI